MSCEHEWKDSTCIKCGIKCDGKGDQGKLRWSLLPFDELEEVVKVLEHGAKAHSEFSWMQVPDGQRRYWDAAFRHLIARYRGESKDKDTGLHPLAHLICDALFIMALDKVNEIKRLAPVPKNGEKASFCRPFHETFLINSVVHNEYGSLPKGKPSLPLAPSICEELEDDDSWVEWYKTKGEEEE